MIWLYLVVYFRKSFAKISKIYTIKECVFDFDCCPSVLNSIVAEWLFKGSLSCIQKLVESHEEIQVMWDIGDVECCGCEKFGIWAIRDVGCLGCGLVGMWDVPDVECSGCEMFGIWNVRNVGSSGCGMWNVGCFPGCGMLIYKMPWQLMAWKTTFKLQQKWISGKVKYSNETGMIL